MKNKYDLFDTFSVIEYFRHNNDKYYGMEKDILKFEKDVERLMYDLFLAICAYEGKNNLRNIYVRLFNIKEERFYDDILFFYLKRLTSSINTRGRTYITEKIDTEDSKIKYVKNFYIYFNEKGYLDIGGKKHPDMDIDIFADADFMFLMNAHIDCLDYLLEKKDRFFDTENCRIDSIFENAKKYSDDDTFNLANFLLDFNYKVVEKRDFLEKNTIYSYGSDLVILGDRIKNLKNNIVFLINQKDNQISLAGAETKRKLFDESVDAYFKLLHLLRDELRRNLNEQKEKGEVEWQMNLN